MKVELENVDICYAQPSDLVAMAKILKTLFTIEKDFIFDFDKHYAALKQLYNEKNADLFVAKYKNGVVGMVTMQRLISTAMGGDVGLVEDVVVCSKLRGSGIGTKLMTHLIEHAHIQGYKRVQLLADNSNLKAHDFYEALGFRSSSMGAFYLEI